MNLLKRFHYSTKRFTQNHEWLQPLENRTVRLGITDYAQQALGDLVYIELFKSIPSTTSPSNPAAIGLVESVKGASDLYSPLPGKILRLNEEVLKRPSLINRDAEGAGWLCEIQLEQDGEKQMSELFTRNQYDQFCLGK